MRSNLSASGLLSSSFMEWGFMGTLLFAIGIIFPGWHSFISVPIGGLFLIFLAKYFLRFKEIEFNDVDFFIKSPSGNREKHYPLCIIQTIQRDNFFLVSEKVFRIEFIDTDGGLNKLYACSKYVDNWIRFGNQVRALNQDAIVDLEDPFDKLSSALKK